MSARPEVALLEDETFARLAASGAPGEEHRYGDEGEQLVETFGDPHARPVVLVHGGFFRPTIDRSHARPAAAALADAGWRVLLPEYRRVPGSPFVALEDLLALDRALGSPEALWVGHSAGGTLALLRALAPTLSHIRVLGLAAVSDLARASREGLGDGAVTAWVGGTPEEQPGRYRSFDPRGQVSRFRQEAALLLHGSDDATVPVSHSVDFPGEHRVLDGAHHADLVDPGSTAWPTVLSALSELSR